MSWPLAARAQPFCESTTVTGSLATSALSSSACAASRSTSGYRLFPAETVDRIRFIKQAQEVGFSLREISELFSTGEGLKQCRAVHDLILGKLTDIDARLQQMKIFRLILKRHLIACEKEINDNKEQAVCPVLVTIK